MKLALGTVQFGLNYGVANHSGQVSLSEARGIVENAFSCGVDTLDTAIVYGDSEKRLGEIGVTDWKVISKLPPIPDGVTHISEWVQAEVLGSLTRLNIPRLYGLLLHCSQELLGPNGDAIYNALIALKNQDKIRKIGVSIYSPDELDALWPKFKMDLVQSPFNVIDRRLATTGWMKRLYLAGIEIHTRSAFLQGLLLMSPGERPAIFDRWQPMWENWQNWLCENAVTPLQACLAFPLSQPEISRVVLGVDSLKQLKEILPNIKTANLNFPEVLSSNDENLINPSLWKLTL